MANVSYIQPYENYTIAVVPLNDGKFDVQFMIKDRDESFSIEVCNNQHHAVEGAKKFPRFYEIAKKNGFEISDTCFRHREGADLHFSYAMDLDRTEETFTKLLLDAKFHAGIRN